MNAALRTYIKNARSQGHDDARIQQDLVAAGWDKTTVQAGLKGEEALVVPPPPSSGSSGPQPVVQNFSTRGLEYIIMFIAMGVAAVSLGSLLHSTVNTLLGSPSSFTSSDGAVSFATAALVVGLPIFAFLFLRLKKAEELEPSLRHDPSRKRAIQLTLVVTFLVGLGNVIYFLYSLMAGRGVTDYNYNAVGSPAASGPLGNFIHLLITLAIAGGIFMYYWRDEHQAD